MKYLKYIVLIFLFQLSACAKNNAGVDTMNKALAGNFTVTKNPQNGTISYLKSNKLKTLSNSKHPKEKAYELLQNYRHDFLIKNPRLEFKVDSVKKDNLGFTRVKLSQHYKGIPVWKSLLSLHYNRSNSLHLVRGEYFPTPSSIDINDGMDEKALFQKVAQTKPELTAQNFTARKIIFFKDNTNPRLAYELTPSRHANLASNTFIVDALTGNILNQTSRIQTKIQTLR